MGVCACVCVEGGGVSELVDVWVIWAIRLVGDSSCGQDEVASYM